MDMKQNNIETYVAISLTAARLSIAAVIMYQVILIGLIFIRPGEKDE